tara:strand:+ start:100 stop:543 length:444 start_codon:yes stop_codon:yes gene_type:complete
MFANDDNEKNIKTYAALLQDIREGKESTNEKSLSEELDDILFDLTESDLNQLSEGPFKGLGKILMKRKLKKQYKKSDIPKIFNDDPTDKNSLVYGKSPEEINQKASDYYHGNWVMKDRVKKASDRLSRPAQKGSSEYVKTKPLFKKR